MHSLFYCKNVILLISRYFSVLFAYRVCFSKKEKKYSGNIITLFLYIWRELPLELEGTFDKEEVDVKVEDKKNEVCMSTKPVFQPFSGQGHRLGRWVGSCSVLSRSRGLTNIPTSLYYRVDDIRRAYHFSRWKWGFSY